MNEIGKPRTVTIRRRQRVGGKNKLVPQVGEDGQPETRVEHAEVWRVTKDGLDGTFCRDRGRKLVVGLVHPDLLVLRPSGTRQKLTIPVSEVYRMAIFRKANQEQLQKARERKAKKQALKERRALDRMERRLRGK